MEHSLETTANVNSFKTLVLSLCFEMLQMSVWEMFKFKDILKAELVALPPSKDFAFRPEKAVHQLSDL